MSPTSSTGSLLDFSGHFCTWRPTLLGEQELWFTDSQLRKVRDLLCYYIVVKLNDNILNYHWKQADCANERLRGAKIKATIFTHCCLDVHSLKGNFCLAKHFLSWTFINLKKNNMNYQKKEAICDTGVHVSKPKTTLSQSISRSLRMLDRNKLGNKMPLCSAMHKSSGLTSLDYFVRTKDGIPWNLPLKGRASNLVLNLQNNFQDFTEAALDLQWQANQKGLKIRC